LVDLQPDAAADEVLGIHCLNRGCSFPGPVQRAQPVVVGQWAEGWRNLLPWFEGDFCMIWPSIGVRLDSWS